MTDTEQRPDTAPGAYYVTARDGERTAFLLGPFHNDHATALAKVREVRRVAESLDPRAVWWAFGTGRLDATLIAFPAGKLNDRISLLATTQER